MGPDLARLSLTDQDISIDSGGSSGNAYLYDPWWQHGSWTPTQLQCPRPRISIWLSVLTHARDINMTTGFSRTTDVLMNLRLSHHLGQYTRATTYRGSTDPRGLLRRSNPENRPFFILEILSLLRIRTIVWLGSIFGAELQCKLQTASHDPVNLTWQ